MSKYLILFVVFLSGFGGGLLAQHHFLVQDSRKHQGQLAYGIQPNMAFRASYMHKLPLKFRTAVFAGAEGYWVQPLRENHAFLLGGQCLLWHRGAWFAANDLSLSTGKLTTKLYEARAWQATDMLSAGWHGPHTGIMLLAGYTHTLGIKLTHSPFYRTIGYSAARDGWYGGIGGYWQAGFRYQQLIGEQLALSLQLTHARSMGGFGIGALPAFVQLGAGWRW